MTSRGTRVTPSEDLERRLRREGYRVIAGVDEAGRGCIAGPVVAAAVVLPDGLYIEGLRDSKTLTEKQREEVAQRVREAALCVGIGVVSAAMVDALDIVRATHAAMRQALCSLQLPPDMILVDGRPVPDLPTRSQAIVDGDCHCRCIAAASIVAKVHRDGIMRFLDRVYPEYGFAIHKGYCTREHREALGRHGPCPVHRRTFEPVRSALALHLEF